MGIVGTAAAFIGRLRFILLDARRLAGLHQIDRLIRGCSPAPGAWSTLNGSTVKIFEAKPLPAKDPKGIAGKLGEIVAIESDGVTVVCADGRFKLLRVQPPEGKKIEAGEWAKSANLATGARFA